MGVLADIFVASSDQAATYDSNPKRFEAESASWKRFTELELSILWALLTRREAVRDWADSEELSCDPEEVRPFVVDLKRLAQVAHSSGRSLYLWNCV
jgi:hypothetical protein